MHIPLVLLGVVAVAAISCPNYGNSQYYPIGEPFGITISDSIISPSQLMTIEMWHRIPIFPDNFMCYLPSQTFGTLSSGGYYINFWNETSECGWGGSNWDMYFKIYPSSSNSYFCKSTWFRLYEPSVQVNFLSPVQGAIFFTNSTMKIAVGNDPIDHRTPITCQLTSPSFTETILYGTWQTLFNGLVIDLPGNIPSASNYEIQCWFREDGRVYFSSGQFTILQKQE